MYQFFSTLPISEINKRYLKKFKVHILDKKFDTAIQKFPELNGLFPRHFKGSQLLIFDFNKLTDVYYAYLKILASLSKVKSKEINIAFKGIFNYSIHSSKIKDFLCDPDNLFEIHNCIYCDIQKFQTYKVKGKTKIHFQADHVLDEGKCPLVGLSIHNFVPACDVCNGVANKGSQTLGTSKKETLKISPKSRLNTFENDVEFYFTPSCGVIKDLKMFRGDVGWEINFRYHNSAYGRTIDLFHLKERYNAEKKYFGEYIFKRKKYPDSQIKKEAKLLGISFDKKSEELFELEKKRCNHHPMEKCRRELIKQVYGKFPTG